MSSRRAHVCYKHLLCMNKSKSRLTSYRNIPVLTFWRGDVLLCIKFDGVSVYVYYSERLPLNIIMNFKL